MLSIGPAETGSERTEGKLVSSVKRTLKVVHTSTQHLLYRSYIAPTLTHTKSPQTKQPDHPPIPAIIITSYTPSRYLRELFKSKFATFGSGLVQTASGLVSSRTPLLASPLASLLPRSHSRRSQYEPVAQTNS